MRTCICGCGRQSGNAMQDCFPVLPWDSPGLPPRPKEDRCARHPLCAYRDDDPAYCGTCHGRDNCTCATGWAG